MSSSQKALVIIIVATVTVLVAGPVAADWNEGLELYSQGRFAEAAVQFQATVKSNPHWPGGYLMLGRCQLATDQYDEALANLGKAAELGPDDPANTAALARALMAVDRFSEARELLEGLNLETLDPDWKAEVARMRARCLLAEDRATDAVALLQACLNSDPDRAALHQAIAGAYLATGDREAALDDFARAFALDPDDIVSGRAAASNAMKLAAEVADDELAATYYARALEVAAAVATVAPEYENVLFAGEAALRARHQEAAASWFAKAVQQRPQDPLANFYLGLALAALDRDDEAITHLREALGAAPEPDLAVRIHAQLGQLLACRLELTEAARQYRAAGDSARTSQIEESAAGFEQALARLTTLREDSAKLAGMEAELEELGDANGVAALASRREAMNREIAGIEANLSQVRTALCR
jgi:tetratricopeptide (TPR) repeat protein